MIRLPDVALPPATLDALKTYQAVVDGETSYEAQVAKAKVLFKRYNKRGNAAFDEVKIWLDQMCAGARRCAYCEDSMADEVEHIRPKDLYPGEVFGWPNYLYACGPCNSPKGNGWAVFVGGGQEYREVGRRPRAPVTPPPAGDDVLIDPRREDALQFMMLDLQETFRFSPIAQRGTRAYARATYTIKLLHLNDRDVLPRARREAFVDYENFVRRYRDDQTRGVSATALNTLVQQLRRKQHPTVWREMQRQHQKLPRLRDLFTGTPEALNW